MTKQLRHDPSAEQLDAAAKTLKLLADPTRLQIVWALLHGEHSVNELAEHVGAQPSSVSQHLAKLRLADVVRSRRDGNRIFYSAADDHLQSLVAEVLLHTEHVVHPVPARTTQRRSGAG